MEALKELKETVEKERNQTVEEIDKLNDEISSLKNSKQISLIAIDQLRYDREFLRGKFDGLLRSDNLIMRKMIEMLEK